MIEAVTESFELKARIFREADGLLGPSAILATNTSSIPIGAPRRRGPTGRTASAACTS